jgi:23S rRNA pseudouridine2605 synthase
VLVDGEVARVGQKIDPSTGRVEVDGLPLPLAPELVSYLIYKPLGVVSTAEDPQGRPTVVELVPAGRRVYPAGRLDADSEGLMILTNDGDLTLRVTHPRYGIHKTYVVLVGGTLDQATLRRITSGIELDDGPAAAVAARLLDESEGRSLVEVRMAEGRKRIVRRMFHELGHPVERLVRTAIGPIRDSSLKAGKHRALTIDEIRSLYAAGEEGHGGRNQSP